MRNEFPRSTPSLPSLTNPIFGKITAVHTSVKGRVRLHIAGLRRNEQAWRAIERHLKATAGVRSVSTSVQTGNVLVRFDPELPWEAMLQATAAAEWTLDDAPDPAPTSTHAPASSLRDWWGRLRGREQPSGRAPENAVPVLHPSMILPAEVPAWHAMSCEEVLQRLESSPETGLSESVARERLLRYGSNRLTQPQPPSYVRLLLDQLKSLPVLLLMGSSVVSLASGGIADAIFILTVVGLNAFIGAETEMRAEKIITSLAEPGDPHARVMRDGHVKEIRAADVVPGDIVLISRGHYLPADSRVIAAETLTIDESALTGESLPVMKQPSPVGSARETTSAPLSEQRNMVFRGTAVTGGSGRAVVVATGDRTEMGQIQAMMLSQLRPPTLLEERLDKLGRQLALVTCGLAGAVFVLGWMRGYSLLQMVRTSVSLAIAAVPEGLPVIATAAMAHSMAELQTYEVLVRHRAALEALGDINVLCLDKTGTITANQMSVMAIAAGRQRWRIHEGKLSPAGAASKPAGRKHLEELARVAVLCSEAWLETGKKEIVINGSATESALVQMAVLLGLDVDQLRRRFPRRKMWVRSEIHPYMATLHEDKRSQLLAVKGSPAEVVQLCTRYVRGGRSHAMTNGMRRTIQAENQAMAEEGFRVLGMAHKEMAQSEKPEIKELTWLGLVGLADPPRVGMQEFLARLHRAGIRTMMITGDQNATASAIAADVGLAGDESLRIKDFRAFLDGDGKSLEEAVQQTDVFARVTPSHKLQIVQALQQRHNIVAMTGDGINDGPALKAADVGIAMGRAGTETAREVADIILLNDHPPSLLAGLRQGRAMQENIRKAIGYLTATNLSESLLVLGCIAGGLGQPLSPRQLLWINLLTDVFPSLALAVEPPRTDLLQGPFGGSRHPLLSSRQMGRLGGEAGILSGSAFLSYLYGIARYGLGPQASTLAFLSLTSTQLLHAFLLRDSPRDGFRNSAAPAGGYVPGAVLAGFAVEGLAVGLPPLRGLLGITAVSLGDLAVCCGSAIGGLLMNRLVGKFRQETTPFASGASELTALPA